MDFDQNFLSTELRPFPMDPKIWSQLVSDYIGLKLIFCFKWDPAWWRKVKKMFITIPSEMKEADPIGCKVVQFYLL